MKSRFTKFKNYVSRGAQFQGHEISLEEHRNNKRKGNRKKNRTSRKSRQNNR